MIGPAGNNGPFRCTIAETVGRAERTLFEPRVGTYSWPAGAGVGHGAHDCKWLIAAVGNGPLSGSETSRFEPLYSGRLLGQFRRGAFLGR
jgi:hypothetical protein